MLALLVWLRYWRWVMLGMAITLHGFIGIFMGLKTFSLMMLVMNMCFLRPNEVLWLLSWFTSSKKPGQTVTLPPPPAEAKAPATTAIRDQAKEASSAVRGS